MMNSGSARRRPVTACDVVPRDDRPLRAGGRQDDVGVGDARAASAPTGRSRPPTCAASASACAGRAAGDHDLGDALAAQVLRGERADLAGADDEHAASFETAENLARQRDRGKADRHGAFAERRLGADPLADAERPVERLAQERSGAVTLGGGLEGVLHLSEDLRLADHERIESRRHAEQVPRRRHVAVGEQVRQEGVARELVILAEKRDDLFASALGVGAGDVDLRAIAGGEDDRFGGGRSRDERLDGGADVAAREIELLPQVHGRRSMTHAEEKQVHSRRPLERVARGDEVADGEEIQEDDGEAEDRQPRRAAAAPSHRAPRQHRERIDRPGEDREQHLRVDRATTSPEGSDRRAPATRACAVQTAPETRPIVRNSQPTAIAREFMTSSVCSDGRRV